MNDPDISAEQYCSAYYDRHGSYNDGFPCPPDKYCCQNKDGLKYCCSLNSIQQQQQVKKQPLNYNNDLSSSTIISRLNNDFINQQKLNSHKSLSSGQQQSSSVSGVEVSLPILITNSTLLISICVGLFLLLTIAIILYFCICRRCIKKTKSSPSSSSSASSTASSSSSFDEKLTAKRNSNNRIISSAASSTTTSSSLTTPNALLNIESGLLLDECHSQHLYHHGHHHHQRTLTIDPHHHNHYSSGSTVTSTGKGSIQQQQQHYVNTAIGAISSGSSNLLMNMNNSVSSPNTTQTSLATTSHQLNLNNDNNFLNEFNEQDEEPNEQDFILYTSNNLEFLKSHSLFNGKSPLNYYPSNSMRSSIKSPFDEAINNSDLTTTTPAAVTIANNNDLRFSTFLPPIYVKNHELL